MTPFKLGALGLVLASGVMGGTARADVLFGLPGLPRVRVGAPTVQVAFATPPPPVYVAPPVEPGYTYRQPRWGFRRGWQNPTVFAYRVRAAMNQADADIRYHVQSGSVSPDALRALEDDRQEIERDLSEASQKGYITSADRAHLEEHVQEIRDLRDRYRSDGNIVQPYDGDQE